MEVNEVIESVEGEDKEDLGLNPGSRNCQTGRKCPRRE